ncbi:HyaD/HybD family hydrogenase maturation endopeptidase [Sedimenticola selenatireducens]|uniref:HyaD/HybD family hydrogenase maturation endopeptidase n=1 Tax=Sedimenticola selenatireducens TaxID=191960 RepID=UPI0004901D7C|nr:HyaD/HybD family hydrogenase maturation endopeptidase [Sedimenticola selenatireducens]
MSVVVIGLGNVLLSDEGLGVRAVELLEQRYSLPESVELIDGGTSAIDLLNPLSNNEHVIIADSVKTGAPPCTLVRLADDEVPNFFQTKISPHQIGLSDLLALLTVQGQAPKKITIIGMVPESLKTHIGLSDGINAKMDEMVELLADELRSLGIAIKPRQDGVRGFWAEAGQ